jgi:tRNA A22 N-methylase
VLSVADIGTDHGLLASELTKHFQQVVGVDKSEQALQGGALSLDKAGRRVDFRVGNGLQKLGRGEADVVCIAGMGVHTMCEILNPHSLETLDTQHLILQPTNSRPRHLMLVYDFLEGHGWSVVDECILCTQGRWYITTRFDRSHQLSFDKQKLLPGSILTKKASKYPEFSDYTEHHVQWIGQDKRHAGELSDADRRWLEILSRQ